MNNGKLVGLVVLLCVICPILVGFVWPVDSTSETAWETGDPKDITNDAINAKLPVYVPYNDPFVNNMNVFDANGDYDITPVSSTDNPGPIWVPDSYPGYESVLLDSDGKYVINDIATWKQWGNNTVAVEIKFNTAWMDYMKMDDGKNAEFLIYYPKTDKMYYKQFNQENFTPVEGHKVTFKGINGLQGTNQDVYYDYYHVSGYADLSQGLKVPSYAYWFNGYENKAINIIFNTVNSNLTEFINITGANGFDTTNIAIWINSGIINMALYYNYSSTPYYSASLGSYDLYDKVLLTVDYDSSTIALSGLRNMSSFLDDYTAAIRETIKADWQHPVIFRSFSIDHQSGNNAAWYVANTLSALAETDGSSNFEMNLRDYTANGSCQLNIRNITQHSDKISFTINSTYKLGNIANGNVSITGADGELITVPVNNMLIGLIGNKVYLNGYVLFEATNITKLQINFYDDWKMTLIYYPVNETSVPGFAWLPGGFGLDLAGFCSVGMITSFGSALGLGVYGRRSGARVALVSLSAILCGATYLVLLMSGMS